MKYDSLIFLCREMDNSLIFCAENGIIRSCFVKKVMEFTHFLWEE